MISPVWLALYGFVLNLFFKASPSMLCLANDNDNNNDNDKLYLSRYTVYIIVKYIISIKIDKNKRLKNVHLHKINI